MLHGCVLRGHHAVSAWSNGLGPSARSPTGDQPDPFSTPTHPGKNLPRGGTTPNAFLAVRCAVLCAPCSQGARRSGATDVGAAGDQELRARELGEAAEEEDQEQVNGIEPRRMK